MTAASSLASRIALALIRLLPTTDFSDQLASRVGRDLSDRRDRAHELANRLRDARDSLQRVGAEQQDGLQVVLLEEWYSVLERILSADPDPWPRAEKVLSILQATHGVRVRSWHDPASRSDPDDTRQRRLFCRCPEDVKIGTDFGVTVKVAIVGEGSLLKSFPVPPAGRDVILDLKASGLVIRGPHQQHVRVPADSDSEPVRFELRATRPGPARIVITAWLDGSFLGEVTADVTAYQYAPPGDQRDISSDLRPDPREGELSLLVRYEPRYNHYRFQFMDSDHPAEVLAPLSWPLDEQIDELIGRLELTASGQGRSRAAETMSHLTDEGTALWRGVVPEKIRHQFWERRDRIRHLSIWAENDRVPWELMYPADTGYDEGFLVQQFPVTRDITDRPGLARRLNPHPARFVLPPDSPPAAAREIGFLRELLNAGTADEAVLSEFMPLRKLISQGDFGLLHFACHNFRDTRRSAIRLTGAPFTVANLESAEIGQTLKRSAPLVFINACRSAEAEVRYNDLAGWAEKFLRAGAGAFIGSLWAVKDRSALTFATNFYEQLKSGQTLGDAVMTARQATTGKGADPTWLAYAIYGDPQARMITPGA